MNDHELDALGRDQRVLDTDPSNDLAPFAAALGRLVIQCSFVDHEIRAMYARVRGYEGMEIVERAFKPQISDIIRDLKSVILNFLNSDRCAYLMHALDKFENISKNRNRWVHSVLRQSDGVWRYGYIPRAKEQMEPPHIEWNIPCPDELEQGIFELELINFRLQSVKLDLRPLPTQEK